MPAAWINLSKGRVDLNSDATMTGIIWANNICTGQLGGLKHDLTLITNHRNGGGVVQMVKNCGDGTHKSVMEER